MEKEEKLRIKRLLTVVVLFAVLNIPAFVIGHAEYPINEQRAESMGLIYGLWFDISIYLPAIAAAIVFIRSIIVRRREKKRVLPFIILYTILLVLILLVCTAVGYFTFDEIEMNSCI